MTIPRIMTLVLLGAVASLLIPIATYLATRFSPPLNRDEQAVLAFTPAPTGLPSRTWKPVDAICPVTNSFPGAANHSGATTLNPVPMSINSKPLISFILQGTTSNMAIIDGAVVQEGSSFSGGRVTRIEQNRILVENKKGKKWLSME
jgi:hypothetical protein